MLLCKRKIYSHIHSSELQQVAFLLSRIKNTLWVLQAARTVWLYLNHRTERLLVPWSPVQSCRPPDHGKASPWLSTAPAAMTDLCYPAGTLLVWGCSTSAVLPWTELGDLCTPPHKTENRPLGNHWVSLLGIALRTPPPASSTNCVVLLLQTAWYVAQRTRKSVGNAVTLLSLLSPSHLWLGS